jgi:hypothetical protein
MKTLKNGLKIFSTCLLCAVILLLSAGQPVSASSTVITAAFPEFNNSNIASFNLVEIAALSGNSIVLTPSQIGKFGAVWWKQKVSLENHRSFSAYFTFDISEPFNNGADGLVFAVQTQSNGAGESGGGMGYEGITPSLGIEYDIFKNDSCHDDDANHIGIDLNGNIESLQKINVDPIGILENGDVYYSWIDYDGNNNLLEVRLAKNSARPIDPLLSYSINLETYIDQAVYVGFSAATGSSTAKHRINSFYFNNDFISGGITPSVDNYTTGAASLQLSASPTEIYANSSHFSTITATARDISGAAMPGQTVDFITDLGSLSASSALTDDNGTATVYLRSHSEGTAAIRATAEGGAFGETEVDFLKLPMGVGGVIQPVNRFSILIPWLVLILVLSTAASASWIKRRKY